MLTDQAIVEATNKGVPGHLWWHLHDWLGWKALTPTSADTSTPTL